MRKQLKTALSTIAAVTILGGAVMLSVSSAEGPYRHAGENAFNGPPLGHPDKALIQTHWLTECDAPPAPSDQASFDWGLDQSDTCPKCGFTNSHVTPVVLDVPELLGPGDATAIDVIKRKLGINVFRGSIFEEPAFPTARLYLHDAPPVLRTQLCDSGSCAFSTAQRATSCDSLHCDKSDVAAVTAVDSKCDVCQTACDKAAATTACAGANPNGDAASTAAPAAIHGIAFASSIGEDSVAALRRASVDLDEAAMRLEAGDRYAEADALREAAQHLRVKARGLKQSASAGQTTTASQPPYGSVTEWLAPPVAR